MRDGEAIAALLMATFSIPIRKRRRIVWIEATPPP
jgi:hypothetical protein